jgi:hypothetical protein
MGKSKKNKRGMYTLKYFSQKSASASGLGSAVEFKAKKKKILIKMYERIGGMYLALLPIKNSEVNFPGEITSGTRLRKILLSKVK